MIRPGLSQTYLEGMRPEMLPGQIGNLTRQIAQPPQLQRTQTIRNDVNLKKNTLKLVRDPQSPSKYHLEFTFDAAAPCNISVFFVASERNRAGKISFEPLKEIGAHPVESREQGLNQHFRTRESHALDTTLYPVKDLSAVPEKQQFPIIVCLEATGRSEAAAGNSSTVTSQTTFGNISSPTLAPTVVPLKQKIQVGGHSYELQEIYGIADGSSGGSGADGGEASGGATDGGDGGDGGENARECVICMTEPRDTTVLPCRHMCMCSECAKVLRTRVRVSLTLTLTLTQP